MKRITLICLYILLSSASFAQISKKSTFNVELSTFLNQNGDDIDYKNRTAGFSQKNNMGTYVGVSCNINSKRVIYFQFAGGLRFNPQTIYFEDGSKEQFLDAGFYVRYMLGLRFRLSVQNNLLFGLGFNNIYSFSTKNMTDKFVTTPYKDPKTGETLNHLAGIYELSWGNEFKNISEGPFIICPSFQIGLENTSLLPNKRKLGIAFEFSTRIGSNPKYGNGHSGTYYKFDTDRNLIATQNFRDRYTTIGLNLFMALN